MRNEEDAAKVRRDLICGLLEKRELVLSVTVSTPAEAEEIVQWMYASVKPMRATLNEVGWNKNAISAKLVEALRQLQEVLAVEKL